MKILYDNVSGEIRSYGSDAWGDNITVPNGFSLLVVPDGSNLLGKYIDINNLILVDRVNYGKHILLSSVSSIIGDGISTATITINLKDKDDVTITSDDRIINLSTNGGKLSALSVNTVNGNAIVTFTSVVETKKCTILAEDPSSLYNSQSIDIQLTP